MLVEVQYKKFEKHGDYNILGHMRFHTLEIEEEKLDDDAFVDRRLAEELGLSVKDFKIFSINE